MDEKYIADRIRRLRKKAGWSVDTVGLAVGRSGKTVSAWETAYSTPSADMLVELCRLFNVRIDYIFPPDVASLDSGAMTADEEELLALYRSMDASGREMALCALRGMASHEDTSRVAEGKLA